MNGARKPSAFDARPILTQSGAAYRRQHAPTMRKTGQNYRETARRRSKIRPTVALLQQASEIAH
jgi:hypothetical protein